MESFEPSTILLCVVAVGLVTALSLTEQYAATLAALAAYSVTWLLLRHPADLTD